MPETNIEVPESLDVAVEKMSHESLMTIAAFLLAAGVWQLRPERLNDLLRPEDLGSLGLSNWKIEGWSPLEQVSIDEFHAPGSYLSERVSLAYKVRSSVALAGAVVCGLDHQDDLIRACALRSAVEMFGGRVLEIIRHLRRPFSPENETAYAIASMATSAGVLTPAPSLAGPVGGLPVAGAECIALIHGTNFPPSRPIWSVPGSGQLFVHVAAIRPDIYGKPDYFRWEGGYSDYAREVASCNLRDWILLRGLQGLDVVAHSHGCNVVLSATQLGAKFNRVVLLSCPVHWPKYQPAVKSIMRPQSIRVRMDLVILADRGGQLFPSGTIPEQVLPIWFTHGATTDPGVWILRNLDGYVA